MPRAAIIRTRLTRLAKLCITLALALGGWHATLAGALCARRADCHASASPRAPHAAHETPGRAAAHAAGGRHQAATRAPVERHRATTPATAAPANDPANHHGHCGSSVESRREVAHAAPHDAGHDAGHDAARGDDENVPPATATDLRPTGSSCGHCVVGQSDQQARVKSAAPAFARDAHAAPVPVRHPVAPTPARTRPRPRLAPPEHSPPRGRPLHLLNSALLI